ncbi:hypothetical protein LOK49_LG10G02105 [Camellia lanceoleosa]|uniref:Uncharacterized protein n=1 Tax=Camellia lanceoleosa TaxID=1840588 RepID=A0ACC0G8Z4_9ERIC|nr:hypothetical protein LOK49_LG10G02105 [Camellia lanceoleosa]
MAVVVLVEEKNKRRDLKDFELIKARFEGFKEHLIQIWGFRIRYVEASGIIGDLCFDFPSQDYTGASYVKSIDEAATILLPQTPDKMRELVQLTFYKPPKILPSCVLTDFIRIVFQVLVKALVSMDPGDDTEFLKKQFQEFMVGLTLGHNNS